MVVASLRPDPQLPTPEPGERLYLQLFEPLFLIWVDRPAVFPILDWAKGDLTGSFTVQDTVHVE